MVKVSETELLRRYQDILYNGRFSAENFTFHLYILCVVGPICWEYWANHRLSVSAGRTLLLLTFLTAATQATCPAALLIAGRPAGPRTILAPGRGPCLDAVPPGDSTVTTNVPATLPLKTQETHIMKCQRNEFIIQDPLASATNNWNVHG